MKKAIIISAFVIGIAVLAFIRMSSSKSEEFEFGS
jgi:multisubunit Na+/H+ antiporter MnhC subunit